MKKIIFSVAFLVLAVACGEKPADKNAESRFANKNDYICGMPVMADFTDTLVYKEKTYAFCSAGCRDQFASNPEYYLSISE